MALHIHK